MRNASSGGIGGDGNTNSSKRIADKAKPRHRRVAARATSPRALAEQAERRAQLTAILVLRGRPVERGFLSKEEMATLRPYFTALNKYLRTHEDFAHAQARKVDARHIPLDDVVQVCRLGLVRAVDKFDERLLEKGAVTSLLSYARFWIRSEIGRLLDDEMLVTVPSAHRKLSGEVKATAERLAVERGCRSDDVCDGEVAAVTTEMLRTAALTDGRRLPPAVKAETAAVLRRLHLGHEHFAVAGEDAETRDDDDAVHHVEAAAQAAERYRRELLAEKTREHSVEVAIEQLPRLQRIAVRRAFGLLESEEDVGVELGIAAAALTRAGLGRMRAVVDLHV